MLPHRLIPPDTPANSTTMFTRQSPTQPQITRDPDAQMTPWRLHFFPLSIFTVMAAHGMCMPNCADEPGEVFYVVDRGRSRVWGCWTRPVLGDRCAFPAMDCTRFVTNLWVADLWGLG